MSRGYLLDTNVMSEPIKPNPDLNLMAFMSGRNDAYVSSVTVHELRFGLEAMPDGKRRHQLMDSIEGLLAVFADRIIAVDAPEARAAASMRSQARASGRVLHLADALIAGTAKVHGLIIATRNLSDFDHLGVACHNPWEA